MGAASWWELRVSSWLPKGKSAAAAQLAQLQFERLSPVASRTPNDPVQSATLRRFEALDPVVQRKVLRRL